MGEGMGTGRFYLFFAEMLAKVSSALGAQCRKRFSEVTLYHCTV